MNHNHHPAAGPSLNRLAVSATAHCLFGCAIGEVLGMIIGTALSWGNGATVALSVVLAFISGYALTLTPLLKAGLSVAIATRLALAADTVSITIMEIVDNAIMLGIPGAMDAGLTDWLFWGSLVLSLLVAGLAAYPANRWLIARGRGHAVVHSLPASSVDHGHHH
jgi:uncharacterized membrane protein